MGKAIMKTARSARKSSKGKRWKKGQSSSSNPETKKHREYAKNRFFSPNLGEPSNLTLEAVSQHNQADSDDEDERMSDDIDVKSMGGKTFSTWASNWTDCTNATFGRVHRYWASNSAMHKEILAVLAAITEVIKTEGGKETETEYFAALMTATESIDSEDSMTAIAYLLSIVIKRVPNTVLKGKFPEISKSLFELLGKYAESNSTSLVKSLIKCMASLLKVQDAAVWSDSSTLLIYGGLLSFTVHTKPKIRKATQQAISIILKASNMMLQPDHPPHHPAASATAKFCIQQIEEHGASKEATTVLHILGFLHDILSCFPYNGIKGSCEAILRVMTLGNVMVTCQSMHALHGMLSSHPNSKHLTPELNGQLITALYDYQPSENDVQQMAAWLAVLEKAHINLTSIDEKLSLSHLPLFFTTCINCLRTDKEEVMKASAKTLKVLLENCLAPFVESCALTCGEGTPILRIFQTLESALSYQYHSAWGYVLGVLATAFKVLGKTHHKVMNKCLKSLADLRDSHRFEYRAELDQAVGVAVQVMGPRVVLAAIPLQINGDERDNLEFPRSWLIPVLRDNIKETELGFFISYFLPLAARTRNMSEHLMKNGQVAQAKTYDIIQSQIWSLLIGFCTKPTDLKESFKGIAKCLGVAISDRSDLRMDVMSALRKLILQNLHDDEVKAELSKFAKNFLPILFNQFTTEIDKNSRDTTRLAVLETIKVYLQITDKQLIETFYQKCSEKMMESESTPFKKYALMDLTIAMVPYIEKKYLVKMFTGVMPLLESSELTVQKKAYRLLEELCSAKSDASRLFVKENIDDLQTVLLKSLSSSNPSSKVPRLHCLINIFKQLPDENEEFLLSVVPEAILCTKEVNERARAASYNLLVELCEAMLRWSDKPKLEVVEDYFRIITAGLAGSPHMVSTTVLALTRILFHYKDSISGELMDLLVENTCLLLTSKSREIVQSSLAFTKVLLGSFGEMKLAKYLEKLVSSLVTMKEDCKHHFRFKAKELYERLVRKFGFETLKRLVPESHHKILTNIRKTQERTKRRKLEKSLDDSDDEAESGGKHKPISETIDDLLGDSDSELEEDTTKQKSKKDKQKKKEKKGSSTWLKEGDQDEIIDFLDPSVSKKVLASKPEAATEKSAGIQHDFKMAKDGRLIITEGNDDEDKKKGGKAKKNPIIDDLDELMDAMEGPSKKSRKRKKDDTPAGDDDDDDKMMKTGYQAGGKGIHRKLKGTEEAAGSVYKSKKAHGDMKKIGKLDPYAYVPLNFQQLNKRKRAKLEGQFTNFVKGAKKGALKGKKAKRLQHK